MSEPIDLGKIRDAAGRRSSLAQNAAVEATGEIYRLCTALERALLERDEARAQLAAARGSA